jgi:16S rRNA (cytosine1402-N4)-methyltransferase
MPKHIPVLAKEVISGLALPPGAIVIDGTIGLGGHAQLMLRAIGSTGRLYGFDRDERNLELARTNLDDFRSQITLIRDSYAQMNHHDLPPADAILFDLGYSSVHVDDASRGFSFQNDGPLDMRYDLNQELTAAMAVNQLPKEELARIFRQFGEESLANQIADAIVRARRQEKFVTTLQLAQVIVSAVKRRGKIHPATKAFQALRIFVNDEFGELERGLEAATAQLKPGGQLMIISFHSLEDRIVKQFFKNNSQLEVVTKKPIVATREETLLNPRARSAKLRIARRI